MPNWLYYIPGPVVLGGYGYWRFRAYRVRRDGYRSATAERGWTYQERDRDLLGRCHGYPFGSGRRPRAWHAVTGNDGEFTSFEYSAVYGDSDSESSDRAERRFIQIFALRMPGQLPSLAVYPRGLLGQLARGLRIAAPGQSDFDRSWVIDGSPADVTTAVRVWISAHRRPFRLLAGELWIWADGQMDLDRIEPALHDLRQLAAALRPQVS
ncbi:hypothetical protein [Amycolatopsis benzoatilytica]|uniref:hypothetical protein n=1 Tax=Amycolatopsis benzoatilytica TaxID=346045 RepID=UPI000360CEDE|nr:hypothetical protein [Amycolatopsis benzoatilytica]